MEQLISTKAVGVADAKKRAQLLQQEAKELLLKASDKLQQLKGELTVTSQPLQSDGGMKGYVGAQNTTFLQITFLFVQI